MTTGKRPPESPQGKRSAAVLVTPSQGTQPSDALRPGRGGAARPPDSAPARQFISRNAHRRASRGSHCACALGFGSGRGGTVGREGRGERLQLPGARLQVPGSRPGRGPGAHQGGALAKQDHFPARAPVPQLCSSGSPGRTSRKP